MHLSTLLTSLLTTASVVSAGCYGDGAKLDQANARFHIEQYCHDADGDYYAGQVWKWCYRVGSKTEFLLLEFDRKGGAKGLSNSACKAYLNEIVNECPRGGRKESGDNWSYRVDPGDSCDGVKPHGLGINGGKQI